MKGFLWITLLLQVGLLAHGSSYFSWGWKKTSYPLNSMDERKPVKLLAPIKGIQLSSKDKKLLKTPTPKDIQLVYRSPSVLDKLLTGIKIQTLQYIPIVKSHSQQKNIILKLHLEGDFSLVDSFSPSMLSSFDEKAAMKVHSLSTLMKVMIFAAYDPRIQGISIELGSLTCDYTTLQEIIRIFKLFTSSSKPLIGYSDGMMRENEYLLSRSFQEFYVSPTSEISLYGLSQEHSFYGKLLKRIGIQYDMFNTGAYKLYGAQYAHSTCSKEQREVTSMILTQEANDWLTTVANALQINTNTLQELTWARKTPLTLSEYLDKKMISGILYPDQMHNYLEKKFILKPSCVPWHLVVLTAYRTLRMVSQVMFSSLRTFQQILFLWQHKEAVEKLGEIALQLQWQEKFQLVTGVRNMMRLYHWGTSLVLPTVKHVLSKIRFFPFSVQPLLLLDSNSTVNNSNNTIVIKEKKKMYFSAEEDYAHYPPRRLPAVVPTTTNTATIVSPIVTVTNKMKKKQVESKTKILSNKKERLKAMKQTLQDQIHTLYNTTKTYYLTSKHTLHTFPWNETYQNLKILCKYTVPRHLQDCLYSVKHIIEELKQQHKLKKDPKAALTTLYTHLMNATSPYLKQLETMLLPYYTYSPHFLPVNTYLSSACWPYGSHLFHHTIPYLETSTGPRIAVIDCEGPIVHHDSQTARIQSVITKQGLTDALSKAMKDPDIHAIVLHINSPGGVFVTSDSLWREIRLACRSKPVVACMGSVCASGGYYLAMACDQIVANPQSITGSIGVALGRWQSASLANKLGIHSEILSIGRYSQMNSKSQLQSFTAEERQHMQSLADQTYHEFVTKAALSRNLSYPMMEKVCQGRVWTGLQAYHHGLVDHMGGLWKALDVATQLVLASHHTEEAEEGGDDEIEERRAVKALLSSTYRVQYIRLQDASWFSSIAGRRHISHNTKQQQSSSSSLSPSLHTSNNDDDENAKDKEVSSSDDLFSSFRHCLPLSLSTFWSASSFLHLQQLQ